MTKKRYDIFLDDKIIGTTELEKADAPMGVVFGNITFDNIVSCYDYLRTYCLTNNIEIITDYPDDKLIATTDIPNLKVIIQTELKLKDKRQALMEWTAMFLKLQFWVYHIHSLKKSFLIT